MEVKGPITQYLADAKVMQLATIGENGPWICTLYFVVEQGRLYWLSFPSRRHSRELAQNPRAAVAVAVKTDQPVIGIQAEGTVAIVTDHTTIESVMQKYIRKYNVGHNFYANVIAGKNKHTMYCLTPERVVLFDEMHFPDNTRKEWSVG